MRRAHVRHREPGPEPGDNGREEELVVIDAGELSGILQTPRWLRDVGFSAWLLVGVIVLAVGVVWILSLTQTILMPVLAAAIIASVASPVVSWLARHRLGRGGGAAIVLLGLIALGLGMVVLIVGGIVNESSDLSGHFDGAKDKISEGLQDIGVDPKAAEDFKNTSSSTVESAAKGLLNGVTAGIEGLSSLVFFLSLTALSLFFLLKDGPMIKAWAERHLGVPEPLARTITGRMLQSLRGYFVGVTAVAVFNAVVVGLGALILGVPLIGTIMAVTFLGAYIPYLGAWSAGAFAVVVALGGAGTDAAIGMAIVQLLANGILQQLVQPIAYGAALGIHPLAVLVVTIGGGALFGAAGLILAAPVTSAITRISSDVARARAATAATGVPPPDPEGGAGAPDVVGSSA